MVVLLVIYVCMVQITPRVQQPKTTNMRLGKLAWLIWVHWFRGCNQAAGRMTGLFPNPLRLQLEGLSFSRKAYSIAGDFTQSKRSQERPSLMPGSKLLSWKNSYDEELMSMASSLWSHLRALGSFLPQNLVMTSPCQHTDCSIVKDTELRTNIIQRTFVLLYHMLNKKRL